MTIYSIAYNQPYHPPIIEESRPQNRVYQVAYSEPPIAIEEPRPPSPAPSHQSQVEGAAEPLLLSDRLDDQDRLLLGKLGWNELDFEELEDLEGDDFFVQLAYQALRDEAYEISTIVADTDLVIMREAVKDRLENYEKIHSYLVEINHAYGYSDIENSDADEQPPQEWLDEPNWGIRKIRMDTFEFNRSVRRDRKQGLRKDISEGKLTERLRNYLDDWSGAELNELIESDHFLKTLATQAIEKGDLVVLRRIDPFKLKNAINEYDGDEITLPLRSNISVCERMIEAIAEKLGDIESSSESGDES